MRIKHLRLENIGVFKSADIQIIPEDWPDDKHICTVFTGENGTGKTTILDAIRLFFNKFNFVVFGSANSFRVNFTRSIFREQKFYIEIDGKRFTSEKTLFNQFGLWENSLIPIFDYWASPLATDRFQITEIKNLNVIEIFTNSLNSQHNNKDTIQTIVFFDYLRTSEAPKERELGEFLYQKIKQIINLSLNSGELAYISRTNLQPVMKINGQELTMEKLSSGNLYLIQKFLSLLARMYAGSVLNNVPIADICNQEAVLLIDEAENHLHPKWQKTLIQNIWSIFPNTQIILTTHSPFLVSAVPDTQVFVCKMQGNDAIVENATADYNNLPVEEVLAMPAFSTPAFNKDISDLLERRKQLIKENANPQDIESIEKQLLAKNPDYFGYFGIDKLLQNLGSENWEDEDALH